jgi:hypothetical protein
VLSTGLSPVRPNSDPGLGTKHQWLFLWFFSLSFMTDVLSSYVQPEEKELIKKQGASWYKTMVSDSEYTEFENFTKWLGVSQ